MKRSVFTIEKMDCSHEQALIRKHLGGLAGVGALSFDLPARRLTVEHDLPGEQPLLEALREIGMEPEAAAPACSCHCCGGEAAPLAVLGVADTLRPTSREAISQLHALGVSSVLLTGDNQATAAAIAAQAGIDDARGNLLPEDKLAAMDGLLSRYGNVGMAGGGIDDAPALTKATIGFAMGAAGTDTAIETADVALMDDDLRKLPHFIRLSRATAAVLRQNIALAITIKAVFFALALAGKATLFMAVFADMGASLLVIFNGMRLLRRG